MGLRVIILFWLSLSYALACPEGSGRVWVEPNKSIPMEACLDMEKAEFTVWKLGEQVFKSKIKNELDIQRIQKEITLHPKLRAFDELPRALSDRFQTELQLQNRMLNHNLSVLDLLNHQDNFLTLQDPCRGLTVEKHEKQIYYQDMNCTMSESGAVDLINNSDQYKVRVSSPISRTKGLLKDTLGMMNIEIVDKKNRVVNRGVCKIIYPHRDKDDSSIASKEDSSSFNSLSYPSMKITLADDLSLPLDLRLSDSKKRNKDEEAMDLHLGLGIERNFNFEEGRGFKISGGMEMPVLQGVQDVQGAMDPNNYNVRPKDMQFKLQLEMKF